MLLSGSCCLRAESITRLTFQLGGDCNEISKTWVQDEKATVREEEVPRERFVPTEDRTEDLRCYAITRLSGVQRGSL